LRRTAFAPLARARFEFTRGAHVGPIDVAVLRVDDDFVGEPLKTIDQRADSGTVQ